MVTLLLTAFTICFFTHLTARIPALGLVRLDLVLGLVTLGAALLLPGEDKFRWQVRTSRRLAYFLLYIVISLPLVTWPGSVIRFNLTIWAKSAFFFLLVVTAVRSERQLKWFMFVFLGTQVFRVLEPLYLHVTEGYWGSVAYSHVGGAWTSLNRLSGAPLDVVNPNQLAWVIVNTIPFLYFLSWRAGWIGKGISVAAIPPLVYALFLTGSRSGLISLIVVVGAIVMMSERRARGGLVAIALGVPLLVYAYGRADSGLRDRYLSIVDSTVAGADTRQGRIDGVVRQLGSVSDNPLFGHGIGTSAETNVNVLGARHSPTHNLYIELLQETGIIGFGMFIAYIVTMTRALVKSRRALRAIGASQRDWLCRLISATLAWIVMDVVYSLSCFGASSWEWYLFGGVASVALALAGGRISQAAAPGPGERQAAGAPAYAVDGEGAR